MEKSILNKCYVSKYVTDIEDEELKHLESLKLLSATANSPNPFKRYAQQPDDTPVIGTVYRISTKGSTEADDIKTVFVQNDKAYHCASNYYVHTTFLGMLSNLRIQPKESPRQRRRSQRQRRKAKMLLG